MKRNSYITHHHIISSLGFNSELNFKSLLHNNSGIKKHQRETGEWYMSSIVDKARIDSSFSKIGATKKFTTLEKMMLLSVKELLVKSSHKITERTGLIVATTKGNIDTLSPKSPFYNTQREYLPVLGKVVQDFFEFKDEAIVLSNACVSGVLAVVVADRLIKSKKYDSIIVVSGDLVTEFVLSGFTSFQAMSDEPCKPFSKNRKGITIGEAIASVLVANEYNDETKHVVQVIGTGSSNDANHISGPSRTGEGLYLSVKSALEEAQIKVADIDYISAHGTATIFNDEMESIAFGRLEMLDIPLNSLKGYYGHTLGASGLLETIIGIESIHNDTLIASYGFDELGVSENVNIIKKTNNKPLNVFLKTASGFGGSNTAILLKKV